MFRGFAVAKPFLFTVVIAALGVGVCCPPAQAQMSPEEAQRLLREAKQREKERREQADAARKQARAGRTSDVVIFKIGAIEPPLAEELAIVLASAEARGYKTVVFDIKSGGGYVAVADAMVEAIHEHDKLQYVAYVRSAISAAIWPVLASERVVVEKGGTIGGAQIYSIDQSTGNFLVDEKFNSIKEAEIRGLASKHDHPVDFVASMVVPEPTGQFEMETRVRWIDRHNYLVERVRVEKKRVATYTAAEAEEAGFADEVATSLEALYADADEVDHELIRGVLYNRYLLEALDDHVYGDYYDAKTLSERTPRQRVADRRARGGERWQTEAELDRDRRDVKLKATRAQVYCQNLRQRIDALVGSDDFAVFSSDAERSKRFTARFSQDLARQLEMVETHWDQFEPMVVDEHHKFMKEALEEARKDLEAAARKAK